MGSNLLPRTPVVFGKKSAEKKQKTLKHGPCPAFTNCAHFGLESLEKKLKSIGKENQGGSWALQRCLGASRQRPVSSLARVEFVMRTVMGNVYLCTCMPDSCVFSWSLRDVPPESGFFVVGRRTDVVILHGEGASCSNHVSNGGTLHPQCLCTASCFSNGRTRF